MATAVTRITHSCHLIEIGGRTFLTDHRQTQVCAAVYEVAHFVYGPPAFTMPAYYVRLYISAVWMRPELLSGILGGCRVPADLVLTPGGYRPADRVHLVEPGNVIDHSGGRSRQLTADGKVVADYGPLTRPISDQPLMPSAVRLPVTQEPAPFGQGWITYAAWSNNTGRPVSVLSTTWTVPPAPKTSNGQTIYLFNGIQNSTHILQPVLQWGPSEAGGGNYWSIAAWWVSATDAQYSALSRVEVGDVLLGGIDVLDSSFRYVCGFRGPAGADITIQTPDELKYCVQTLEAYNITAATDYPNTSETSMGQIGLETNWAAQPESALDWTPITPVSDAGQRTVVVSNSPTSGEVDLYY